MLKRPKLPHSFQGRVFKGKFSGKGQQMLVFLLKAAAAAAAAKSLQSCPTLCDPIDGSPPGSSVHGIFQARVLGVVTGQCLGNLVLSLKLSSSTWVRALVSVEELEDLYPIVMHIHWGGTGTLLYTCTIVS